jgi:predicted transcriptional regulator
MQKSTSMKRASRKLRARPVIEAARPLNENSSTGQIIRAWRKYRGFSQAQAAKVLHIQPVLLSRYENGHSIPRGLGAWLTVSIMLQEIESRGDVTLVSSGNLQPGLQKPGGHNATPCGTEPTQAKQIN